MLPPYPTNSNRLLVTNDPLPRKPKLAQEKRQFYEDRARERASVITQPHRTLPIVAPKPKSVHDYPIGSYLRYVKDPNWHTTPTRSVSCHRFRFSVILLINFFIAHINQISDINRIKSKTLSTPSRRTFHNPKNCVKWPAHME